MKKLFAFLYAIVYHLLQKEVLMKKRRKDGIVRIDKGVLKGLKLQAVKEDRTLAEIVTDLAEKYIRRRG